MSARTITLGGQLFEVAPIPLGRLRVLVPAFNRAAIALAGGAIDADAMQDVVSCIAAGVGLTVEQVEALPGQFTEMIDALSVIADVAGLTPSEKPSGN